MASTATPHSQSSTSSKPARILACVLCQHRKIKCDRNFPCQNCTKANVKCTPSAPAPARKRRRPNQDLQERLARCEELLKEYATEKPETSSWSRPSPYSYEDPYLNRQPAGKLVEEDGSVRFMDSYLLGSVYDELRAMREIIDAEDADELTPDTNSTMPDINTDLLIGDDSATPMQGPTVEDLWPEPAQTFRLWQIYVDRVNPLTKIIHVPTVQAYVVEATTGAHRLPKTVEALLFSIFVMATVALSMDECQDVLACSKDQALDKFSSGVRLCLNQMGFLKSHDMATLQALVLYVMSLQGRYNKHSAWILNGVVIRIAQKMGLHRDGDILGLPPFETEIRRRVWWQIIIVDSKYAMMSGLDHSLVPRMWDTQKPKNVNDADIYPSATEPIQDRDGPTEMAFLLMLHRVARFMMEAPGFEAMAIAHELEALHDSFDQERYDGFRRIIKALSDDMLVIMNKSCDPLAGPVHQMAIEFRSHIVEKLEAFAQPLPKRTDRGSRGPTIKENAFRVALMALEHCADHVRVTQNSDFLWFTKMHFQPDVMMYMAGQLSYHFEGPHIDRAWRAAEAIYSWHQELAEVANKQAFKIASLLLRAWHHRLNYFCDKGQLLEKPAFIARLLAHMPDENYKLTPKIDDGEQEAPVQNHATTCKQEPTPNMSEQGLNDFDSLMGGGYLDMATLDWDMFGTPGVTLPMGNMNGNGAGNMSNFHAPFGTGPMNSW